MFINFLTSTKYLYYNHCEQTICLHIYYLLYKIQWQKEESFVFISIGVFIYLKRTEARSGEFLKHLFAWGNKQCFQTTHNYNYILALNSYSFMRLKFFLLSACPYIWICDCGRLRWISWQVIHLQHSTLTHFHSILGPIAISAYQHYNLVRKTDVCIQCVHALNKNRQMSNLRISIVLNVTCVCVLAVNILVCVHLLLLCHDKIRRI